MKTYVLMVSERFPQTHKRAGQQTWFVEKINEAGMPISDEPIMGKKIHTCRSNYPLWSKRIKEVQEGKAVLSLRYWEGKPYRSKQIEFIQLDKDSGVGIQKLLITNKDIEKYELSVFNENLHLYLNRKASCIAENDGLSLDDFAEWFKNYNSSACMAIIHFTNFRY
jgi:hypothetical protein